MGLNRFFGNMDHTEIVYSFFTVRPGDTLIIKHQNKLVKDRCCIKEIFKCVIHSQSTRFTTDGEIITLIDTFIESLLFEKEPLSNLRTEALAEGEGSEACPCFKGTYKSTGLCITCLECNTFYIQFSPPPGGG